MLRAATPHFPRLHEMLKPLYGAISHITHIDKALSEGDFVGLCPIGVIARTKKVDVLVESLAPVDLKKLADDPASGCSRESR